MARARRLSHVDRRGRARMVDVSPKPVTRREAVARGEVRMRAATLAQIAAGALPKGDALAVARLAGIMAAKRTADLVPLCHPLPLAHVDVELVPDPAGSRVLIESRVAVAIMAAAANDPGAASGVLAPPSCGVPSGTPRRSSLRLPLSLPGSFASLATITRTDS